MAMDVNPEIAAALAKLAEQDAAAADDAQAALEWIAGDQGLALITQESIQNFCWYQLPVKWLISLTDKLRVAGALAQALDLLQLPRYAAICRSGTTREILPGILGSTLRQDGHLVWAPSAGSALRAITTLGASLRRLELPAGIGDEHPCDGVEPAGLMPDLHVLPGIWAAVKGYDQLLARE